ncbi:glycosyltransferase family 4 protein [Candidatus Uhrbacteria bacterium]|nr:glycosyltransferase family 4 protein [Candidatus Uhrbacteria bacterium]
MKVAHVVCTYPPYRGGMGAVAFEYVERLRARGHHAHAFVPRYVGTVPDDPAYVHRLPSPLHWGNAGVLPSLVSRLAGFDLVHLHYPFFGGAEPVIMRKALRSSQPLVMTYHMDTAAGRGFKHAVFDVHRRVLFPWIVQRVDRVLVSSLDYAESSALSGFPTVFGKLTELPFGVDLEHFHPGREEARRRELGIPPDAPVLLFVGGMDRAHAFKGVPVLIEALADLAHRSWHAVLVGDGDLRANFETQTAVQGSRLHFLGDVSEQDKPALYRMADFHVFPSTDRSEAFGMVVLEAAASGLPTIASALPGVRTLVEEGETGLLVPPGDAAALAQAILRLASDGECCRRMGRAARQRAERHFAWDPLIDKLEAVYDTCLGQRRICVSA